MSQRLWTGMAVAGLAVLASGGRVAAAEYTWTGATSASWAATGNWTPTGPTWASGSTDTAKFSNNSGSVPNLPGTDTAVFARGVAVNATTTSPWTISGPSALTLTGAANWTGFGGTTTANAQGFDIYGGGTATIAAPVVVGTSNQFWHVNGGTTAVFSGGLSNLASNSLNFRIDTTSTVRITSVNTMTGPVALSGNSGTNLNGAKIILGVNSAFGTGNLNVSGGLGGGYTFTTDGTDRTLGNNTTFSLSTVFNGTASIAFTGTTSFTGTASGRTVQVDINAAGKALSFTGLVNLRTAAGPGELLTLFSGGGRTEFTNNIRDAATPVVGDLGGLVIGTGNGVATIVRLAGAASTYTGRTEVRSGQLLVAANAPSGANGALGNSTADILLTDAGTVSGSVLTDATGVSIGRNIRVSPTGATNAGQFAGLGSNTGDGTFTGSVTVGRPADVANSLARTLRLTAPAAGSATFTGTFSRGTNYTGAITVNKVGAGTVTVGGTSSDFNATLNVSAGTLQIAAASTFFAGPTMVTGGVLNVNGTLNAGANVVNLNAGTTTVNGTLTSAGVTVAGGVFRNADTGTINAGANPINVTGGTFASRGTTNASAVNVAAGGTLDGTNVTPAVTVLAGGKLAAGDGAVGTLTAAANVTVNGGSNLGFDSTWAVKVNGLAGGGTGIAGSDSDTIDVGANTLNMAANGANKLTIAVAKVGGADFTPGQPVTYVIGTKQSGGSFQLSGGAYAFDAAHYNFTFTGFAEATGFTLTADNDLFLLTFTPTPEPISVLGAAAFAMAVGAWVRRRRA